MSRAAPLLWHIPVSHFSEKARWALAVKGIDYERRAPPPGPHMLIALWLTRGAAKTFPVMQIDGETCGSSDEIIAALERRHPQPRLYPAAPEERARALELERYFDDVLGSAVRLLVFYELTREDSTGMRPVVASALPGSLRKLEPLVGVAGRAGSGFVSLRYKARDEQRADEARAKIVAGLERIEAELGEREYLVGDSFTVADLTAASLLYPLVRPPEAPQVITEWPPRLAEWWAPYAERPAAKWVGRMFARHRAGSV